MDNLELKSIITNETFTRGGLYSRFELAEERIHQLEDIPVDIMQSEEQQEKMKMNRASEKCGI